MADEAHKEPTMEEILSSIRKIISEDDTSAAEPEAAVLQASDVTVDAADNDDFEDLTLDDVSSDEEISFGDDFEEEDIFETEASFDDDDAYVVEDDYAVGVEEPFENESIPEPAETLAEPEEANDFHVEPAAKPSPAPEAVTRAPEPAPEPAPTQPSIQEPVMTASAQTDRTALTDDSTAASAAGALGQLISKMDMGSENTIDGLVRELLKPMMKEWLDANLPAIVEAKVEAEVARIARMAR